MSLNFSFYEFAKRFTDILFSVLGIFLLLPIFIIIAILVKTSSQGNIFYLGQRTGRYGKLFKIYKFRSMYLGSEEGPGTTSRNDPRITSIGFYLRKYKLDELPQLFNILKGEMSFVGPRPELKYYTDLYAGEEKIILSVQPGLTDFSSLYFSNLNDLIDDKDPDNAFEKNFLKNKNKLRIEYVKKRNYFLDIKLIFKTIIKVISTK